MNHIYFYENEKLPFFIKKIKNVKITVGSVNIFLKSNTISKMGKALLEVIVFANYKSPSRMISSMRCTVIMHTEITDFVSSQYFLFQSDFKGWLRRKIMIMSLINMVIIAVHQIKMVNFCSY